MYVYRDATTCHSSCCRNRSHSTYLPPWCVPAQMIPQSPGEGGGVHSYCVCVLSSGLKGGYSHFPCRSEPFKTIDHASPGEQSAMFPQDRVSMANRSTRFCQFWLKAIFPYDRCYPILSVATTSRLVSPLAALELYTVNYCMFYFLTP